MTLPASVYGILARRDFSDGRERKEIALQGALEKLAPGPWLERPDTPDGVVTAVRRLAPVEARYAPFPAAIDPRCRPGGSW